jgi:uncharacterized protein (DUF2235 family)
MRTVLGFAAGSGLDDNVLYAYEFLINHYEEGDNVRNAISRSALKIRGDLRR